MREVAMSDIKTRQSTPDELPFQIFAQQFEKLPPCQARCPNSGDIRSWLGIIAQREKNGLSLDEAYDKAWQRLAEFNPMPATIGRICPHPCEDLCNRKDKDGAVSINAMERFLGDWALSRSLALPPAPMERYAESIGVIGSGPASLSFAYQMARRGYQVTIYDKDDRPGGMLRHAIPDYRLPRDILDAEVDRILALNISLMRGVDVGEDLSLEQLRKEHELVFLGLGAQAARRLNIPGEQGPGVVSGIAYLRQRKQRQETGCGPRVIVIGGGNTAIDAARSARREGASVTLVYRRSESEMPATDREVHDARIEGVEFRFLDVDNVLHTGSWLSAEGDGKLQRGLFAGGDDLGPGIASRAIGQGRHAAETAHAELRGLPPPPLQPENPLVSKESVRADYYADRQRSRESHLPEEEWLAHPEAEIDLTLGYEQASEEAARCMSCGLCFDCQQCFMYCNAGGFTRLDETGPGKYFAIALDVCEGCGKCIELCPCGYLESRADA
jgi:NADPH-dependent glutamate synthase beta subunit-like oxidoreductase